MPTLKPRSYWLSISPISAIVNNSRRQALLLMWISTGFLNACSHLPPPIPKSQPDDYAASEYFQWLQTAPVVALQEEHERLSRQHASLVGQIQLALLLSASQLASETSTDTAMDLLATSVVRPVQSPQEADYLAFANLWQTSLARQLDLRAAKESIQALKRELTEIEEEKLDLQKRMKVLTAIEEHLMQQEQTETER